MIKKIIIFILIITLIFINVLLDINISNYINCLNKCFNKNITLNNNYIAFIYSIIAIISVLILLDTILTIYNKKSEIKGINLKEKDGTYGTANWLNEKNFRKWLNNSMKEYSVLSINNALENIYSIYNNEDSVKPCCKIKIIDCYIDIPRLKEEEISPYEIELLKKIY